MKGGGGACGWGRLLPGGNLVSLAGGSGHDWPLSQSEPRFHLINYELIQSSMTPNLPYLRDEALIYNACSVQGIWNSFTVSGLTSSSGETIFSSSLFRRLSIADILLLSSLICKVHSIHISDTIFIHTIIFIQYQLKWLGWSQPTVVVVVVSIISVVPANCSSRTSISRSINVNNKGGPSL